MRKYKRLDFLDLARGITISVMALDHVSYYWNKYRESCEGFMMHIPHYKDISQMFVRVITHFTPTSFIFIAGWMIFLHFKKLEYLERSGVLKHYLLRFVKLMFLQFTLVNFAFMPFCYFNVNYKCIFFLDVLWAIAGGSLLLAFFLRYNLKKVLLSVFLLSFFILPIIPSEYFNTDIIWLNSILFPFVYPYCGKGAVFCSLYTVLNWFPVLVLGYYAGMYFDKKGKFFIFMMLPFSLFMFLLFVFIKGANSIGNRIIYERLNILNFFSVSKYPPDLSFFFFTFGFVFFIVALSYYLSKKRLKYFLSPFVLFGRNALFFYCVHLFVYWFYPFLFFDKKVGSIMIICMLWIGGLVIMLLLIQLKEFLLSCFKNILTMKKEG